MTPRKQTTGGKAATTPASKRKRTKKGSDSDDDYEESHRGLKKEVEELTLGSQESPLPVFKSKTSKGFDITDGAHEDDAANAPLTANNSLVTPVVMDDPFLEKHANPHTSVQGHLPQPLMPTVPFPQPNYNGVVPSGYHHGYAALSDLRLPPITYNGSYSQPHNQFAYNHHATIANDMNSTKHGVNSRWDQALAYMKHNENNANKTRIAPITGNLDQTMPAYPEMTPDLSMGSSQASREMISQEEPASQESRNPQLDGTASVANTRPQRQRRKSVKVEEQAYLDLSDAEDSFEQVEESDSSVYEDDEQVV